MYSSYFKIDKNFHIDQSCFIQNDHIIIDYPIIRKLLKTEKEKTILQHIKNTFISSPYDKIDIHLNMKKFTANDMVYHIHLINTLINIMTKEFPDKVNHCYIYNSSPILSIYQLFNNKNNLIFIN